jgi:tetratricopeptide (TPR) repeat protein
LSDNESFKIYDLRTTTKIIFESLYDSEKARQWFPTIHIIHKNETANIKQLESDGIEYVARITEAIKYSSIKGTIESLDGKSTQHFEWIITENESVKKWSRLTTKTKSSEKRVNWISPLPGVGIGVGLIAVLQNGFANMTSAYATTAIGSASPLSQTASVTVSSANTSGSGVMTSKTVLTAIVVSTLVATGGGITFIDAYYSDPLVEFRLSPAQLPADLHGTSLMVTNVFSSDSKSSIVNYDCNVDSIIYDLEYTFDCFTENSLGGKEVIRTTLLIKGPNDVLEDEAADCVSGHYGSTKNLTSEYPYLLELPNFSPNKISELKKYHISLMDTNYEKKDYESAKKHATIVLKYFNINDLQALSTLGNLIRDDDRLNIAFTKCAIAIHSTPLLSNSVWGKISLAEDYHVLGEYNKSISWSSKVINDYEHDPDIHVDNYVNALIIKANALYRLSLDEQNGFDDAKAYYASAHGISESYDTWFGLGNVDRHEGQLADALIKYKQAKLLTADTAEIDDAINRVLLALNAA